MNVVGAIRLVAARRLQKTGWAIVHYAQAIERACLKPSAFREDMVRASFGQFKERCSGYLRARRAYRQARKLMQ